MKAPNRECEFDVLARSIAWMCSSGLYFFAVLNIFSTPIIAAYSIFVATALVVCECSCLAWTCGYKKEKGTWLHLLNSDFFRAFLYGCFASGGLCVYAYIQSNYFLMVLFTVLLIDSGLYLILGCQVDVYAEAKASAAGFGHGVGPVMY